MRGKLTIGELTVMAVKLRAIVKPQIEQRILIMYVGGAKWSCCVGDACQALTTP
jgi:hypothetical protein